MDQTIHNRIPSKLFLPFGPIDLKFSGIIFGHAGFPARGLLEMCMIHFKSNASLLMMSMACNVIHVFEAKGVLLTSFFANFMAIYSRYP